MVRNPWKKQGVGPAWPFRILKNRVRGQGLLTGGYNPHLLLTSPGRGPCFLIGEMATLAPNPVFFLGFLAIPEPCFLIGDMATLAPNPVFVFIGVPTIPEPFF